MSDPYQPFEPLPPAARPASSLAGLLLLVLVFAVGLAVGQSGVFGAEPSRGTSQPPSTGPAATVPPDAPGDFDLFWQALQLIRTDYVGRSDVTDQQLTYGAIRGMIDALGDTGHSVFLTADQVQAEQHSLGGNVVGIGVLLGQRNGTVVVLSVVQGGPAQKAGMAVGDEFAAIDGQDVTGQGPDAIAAKVRGDAGTTVSITVHRPTTSETLTFSIVREQVQFPSATWAIVPGTQIAFLRLIEFSTGSAAELQKARDDAVAAGAQSLILDLRGNPGGFVDEAVNVASLFIHGKQVYIRELADGERIPVNTNDSEPSTDLPLVVLIDQNTASSAEIVSGALQSAHRAELIGQTTFGTGTVLQTYPLPDGSAIRLAFERWLTPDGQLIFGHGITPDVDVALADNEVSLEPNEVGTLTPDAVTTMPDSQLLDAVEFLTGTLPSPLPSAIPSPQPS